MPEGAEGLEVPKGDPGALRGAAGIWASAAELLERQATTIKSSSQSLSEADWYGDASGSYYLHAVMISSDFQTAAGAARDGAAAARTFAHELEDAQHRAREAIKDARAAQKRIDAAEEALVAARGAALIANAKIAAASVEMTLASAAGPAGAGAYSSAEADHRAASGALADAQVAETRAQNQLTDAKHDLTVARRHGRDAMDDARRAGTRASSAFHAAGGRAGSLDIPYAVAPVPVSLRGRDPNMAPAWAGGFGSGGAFRGIGRFATPADARAAQIARGENEARLREAAAREAARGGMDDRLGGVLAGGIGWDFGIGDPNTGGYRSREQIMTAVTLVGPGAIRKGGKEALEAGAKELAEEGAERKVKRETLTASERAAEWRAEAKRSTERLTKNLEAEVGTKPPGTATHHLVPKGEYVNRTASADLHSAQAKLAEFGVGPDDAANGAFLPHAQHRPIHTDRYFRALRTRLADVETPAEAQEVMRDIRQEVMDGKFDF